MAAVKSEPEVDTGAGLVLHLITEEELGSTERAAVAEEEEPVVATVTEEEPAVQEKWDTRHPTVVQKEAEEAAMEALSEEEMTALRAEQNAACRRAKAEALMERDSAIEYTWIHSSRTEMKADDEHKQFFVNFMKKRRLTQLS